MIVDITHDVAVKSVSVVSDQHHTYFVADVSASLTGSYPVLLKCHDHILQIRIVVFKEKKKKSLSECLFVGGVCFVPKIIHFWSKKN